MPRPTNTGQHITNPNTCPRCGVKITKASGRCSSCGFLFGSKYRATQPQQKTRKSQPNWQSTTPPDITSQRQPKFTPEPIKKRDDQPARTEKERLGAESTVIMPFSTGASATEKQKSVAENASILPQKTPEVTAPEGKRAGTESTIIMPFSAEVPVSEKQKPVSEAGIIMPFSTGVPTPEEEQQATQAKDATPQTVEIPPPEEQPVMEAASTTTQETSEMPVAEEKHPDMEPLSTAVQEAPKTPATEEKQSIAQTIGITSPIEDDSPVTGKKEAELQATGIMPPATTDFPIPEEETDIETLGITTSKTAKEPAPEEQQPVSIAPQTVEEVSVLEEGQTANEAISATSQEPLEVPASEEKQPFTQALSIMTPTTPTVPPPREIQPVIKALRVMPPKLPAIRASREIQVVTEAVSDTPQKTEITSHNEKQTDTETPIITPPPTHKAPVPESESSKKYQSVFTTGGWYLPPINILDKPTEMELSQSDIEKRAKLIEEAINSYGVEAKVVQINVGPTVTQFGVEPGWDRKYKKVRERDEFGNVHIHLEEVSKTRVKVDRISALANDLALALAAPSIRIEAPVPGKSVVGIEVPNTTFSLVNLRSVIESSAFQKAHARSKLALALGKGAGGETVAGYLDRMPHLLIAGATGSGKTACLNSIICCLLIHNTPDDVQFIMIDPKRVELINYNTLPHLVAPVIVDSEKAIMALRWLNQEMDNRYHRFARAGARNIDSYNANRQHGDIMPYIVVVIDELADLMMTAFDEVEQTLCRLAQLARATGIHLIVATQRPSVDVVTGLIKANFPTRISFALTSQVDSRTILDSAGAEKLLGRGDMLYMPTDASKPKRLQGTFISDAEIERIVDFWGNQRRPDAKPIKFEDMEQLNSIENKSEDAMLQAARQLAIEYKNISTSFLQRRLRIGYPRAARLMEKLEEEGYGKGTMEEQGQ